MHYWSFNGNLTRDEAGTADLFDTLNASLVEDRSAKALSALQLNNGYTRLPSGVYFSKDFTLLSWIKYTKRLANLFSFSNSFHSFNVFFDVSKTVEKNDVHYMMKTQCILSLNDKPLIAADVELKLNEWIHLSLVSNNNSLRLYLNNSLKAETFFEMFRNEYFDSNYIGKQNDNNLMEYTIVYDEIKIFERSLNEYELRKQTGFYESTIFKVIISLKEKAMQIFL